MNTLSKNQLEAETDSGFFAVKQDLRDCNLESMDFDCRKRIINSTSFCSSSDDSSNSSSSTDSE